MPLLKSIDGGKTFNASRGRHHGDHHDLWIDPKNPKRMIDTNDGGVDITTNGGKTWFAPPLPIASSTTSTPTTGPVPRHGQHAGPRHAPAARATACSAAASRLGDWHTVGGGETGFAVPDPTDPNIVYAGEYGGILTRYDHRTRQARNVSVYRQPVAASTPAELKYRFQWTAPILVSPHDPKTVYHARQRPVPHARRRADVGDDQPAT